MGQGNSSLPQISVLEWSVDDSSQKLAGIFSFVPFGYAGGMVGSRAYISTHHTCALLPWYAAKLCSCHTHLKQQASVDTLESAPSQPLHALLRCCCGGGAQVQDHECCNYQLPSTARVSSLLVK